MIERTLKLPDRRSCLLLGPRQTGKTTLVRQILRENAWQIDLLRQDTYLRYAKDPAQFRREAEARIRHGVSLIFIDEIQKIPALFDDVHSLIEATGIRFVLAGSSARKLRRSGTNLLAGRATVRHLHPLTFQEQENLFDLERTLRLGSLPAVVAGGESDAIELLEAYAQSYLREEVQAEALVRNLGAFGRFLDVAAAQCGDILNYSAVGRDAAVAVRTVQEYFQILEDTLLGFRLEPWRRSVRNRLVMHPRFYLFDTGVTNAINRQLTGSLDPIRRGRLFEQWIVLETWRMLDYLRTEARIYFWRTNHGAEVDLLVERHQKLVLAAEIKAKKRIVPADLSGLRSFHDAHPEVPRLVIAEVPEEFDLEGCRVLPYQRWLGSMEPLIRKKL